MRVKFQRTLKGRVWTEPKRFHCVIVCSTLLCSTCDPFVPNIFVCFSFVLIVLINIDGQFNERLLLWQPSGVLLYSTVIIFICFMLCWRIKYDDDDNVHIHGAADNRHRACYCWHRPDDHRPLTTVHRSPLYDWPTLSRHCLIEVGQN